MLIRDATPADWPQMWRFMRPIVRAGETYAWDIDASEDWVRRYWLHEGGRGVVLVAVDDDGCIAGTAEMHPNHGGPGAHVANAGFMVDAGRAGRGVGRALGEAVVLRARSDGYLAMQFNAVVETNVGAVKLWRSLGFEVLATVPEAFAHPSAGRVGLHIMYRRL